MRRIPALAVAGLLSATVPLTMAQTRHPKNTIALAPVGATALADIEALAPSLRDAFDAEVVVAPTLNLPPSALDRRRGQYLSTALLDVLARAKRPEWERLLGVADVDLFVPGLNFVFGEGDAYRGVAIFSLARLRSPDRSLFGRRSATEAIHELGHSYGLSHCDDPRCVMWFSNTLAETDRKGFHFCRAHADELASIRRARSAS